MATHKPVTAVEVRLWNRRVGAVALDPRLGYYAPANHFGRFLHLVMRSKLEKLQIIKWLAILQGQDNSYYLELFKATERKK